MLELASIEKKYQMGDNIVYALKDINIKIEEGDFVAIMGPSGSGKSTLMNLLGLLDVPTAGSYKVNGVEVSHMTEDELAVLRREEIGFIFQQFNLLPRMTALQNVALPLLYSEKEIDLARAQEFLKQVGLEDRTLHKTNELSGGQQQRVAIARSLINRPMIILADEPTGNLDSKSEKEILGILRSLNESGITIIIVTHEEEVGQQAKRLIRMRDGVILTDERMHDLVKVPNLKRNKPASKKGFSIFDILDYFRQGYKTLSSNKVRTALSMLGILIGVAAVVAMLAIGNGAQKAIEAQLSSLGSNLLVLRPGALKVGGVSQGAASTTRLTIEDNAAIKDKIDLVKDVSPNVSGRVQVTFMNKNWSTQATGSGSSYAAIHTSIPEIGRFFTDEENQKRSRVAVLGATVIREIFGDQNPIGEMIKINRVNFQVIGILPPKGATGWRDQDDTILIPVQTAMQRLMGKKYLDYIDIEVGRAEDMDEVQDRLTSLMLSRHKIPISQKDDAFDIRNMADIQAALSESSKTMSILLASIAAISLLVGGIGIMNIMLVSVTERTREIGLRKAVGARRIDILAQFLAEAVVVSAVGGIFGIVLGWLISIGVGAATGWLTAITLSSVLISLFFSAGIGIVFGIYPAKRASQLHPIEALRYE